MAGRRKSALADSPSTVSLEPILDIRNAGPLADQFRAARGHGVMVDASGVERLGGQCLQILIAAANTWRSDGHRFCLTDPSESFVADLGVLGITVGELTSGDKAA